MLTLTLLAGLWSTICTQTQVSTKQGFTIESYAFTATGDFEYACQWFDDDQCKTPTTVDIEQGTLKLSQQISLHTFEADFKTLEGADFGVIYQKANTLKVGRGFLNTQMRNTMTGSFEFTRQK